MFPLSKSDNKIITLQSLNERQQGKMLRIHLFFLCWLIFCSSSANAQPVVKPDIILPKISAQPVPVNPPTAITKLNSECLYVIQANTDCLVLSSPNNMVKITKETGPIKIRAKFVEDPGTLITRTFTSKFVFVVEAQNKGKCELIIVSSLDESTVIRQSLEIGEGVIPDPPKPDPPKPDPNIPLPGTGFKVLILEETAERTKLPQSQINVLFSKTIREYLNNKCSTNQENKTKDWAIWDKDVDASQYGKIWTDAVIRPKSVLPWIIISNGKEYFEGPLPKTVEETLILLKKYGGE